MTSTTEYPIEHASSTRFLLPVFPAIIAGIFVYVGLTTGRAYLSFIAIAPGIIALLLGYLAYAASHMSIVVSPSEVVINVPLNRKAVPRSAIRREAVQRVDLALHPELNTALRTNGVELEDLRQGWFKLKNGEKALVLLTDEQNAIYIPTTQGYALLVSPPRPDEFLAQLKQ